MKKLLFMGILFLSASAFANEKFEKEKDAIEKEDVAVYCCKATLTYKGLWWDEVTVCGGVNPCAEAKDILLARNKNTGLE